MMSLSRCLYSICMKVGKDLYLNVIFQARAVSGATRTASQPEPPPPAELDQMRHRQADAGQLGGFEKLLDTPRVT